MYMLTRVSLLLLILQSVIGRPFDDSCTGDECLDTGVSSNSIVESASVIGRDLDGNTENQSWVDVLGRREALAARTKPRSQNKPKPVAKQKSPAKSTRKPVTPVKQPATPAKQTSTLKKSPGFSPRQSSVPTKAKNHNKSSKPSLSSKQQNSRPSTSKKGKATQPSKSSKPTKKLTSQPQVSRKSKATQPSKSPKPVKQQILKSSALTKNQKKISLKSTRPAKQAKSKTQTSTRNRESNRSPPSVKQGDKKRLNAAAQHRAKAPSSRHGSNPNLSPASKTQRLTTKQPNSIKSSSTKTSGAIQNNRSKNYRKASNHKTGKGANRSKKSAARESSRSRKSAGQVPTDKRTGGKQGSNANKIPNKNKKTGNRRVANQGKEAGDQKRSGDKKAPNNAKRPDQAQPRKCKRSETNAEGLCSLLANVNLNDGGGPGPGNPNTNSNSEEIPMYDPRTSRVTSEPESAHYWEVGGIFRKPPGWTDRDTKKALYHQSRYFVKHSKEGNSLGFPSQSYIPGDLTIGVSDDYIAFGSSQLHKATQEFEDKKDRKLSVGLQKWANEASNLGPIGKERLLENGAHGEQGVITRLQRAHNVDTNDYTFPHAIKFASARTAERDGKPGSIVPHKSCKRQGHNCAKRIVDAHPDSQDLYSEYSTSYAKKRRIAMQALPSKRQQKKQQKVLFGIKKAPRPRPAQPQASEPEASESEASESKASEPEASEPQASLTPRAVWRRAIWKRAIDNFLEAQKVTRRSEHEPVYMPVLRRDILNNWTLGALPEIAAF